MQVFHMYEAHSFEGWSAAIKEELRESDYISTSQSMTTPNECEIKEEVLSESIDVQSSAVNLYRYQDGYDRSAARTGTSIIETTETSVDTANNINRQIIPSSFGCIKLEDKPGSVDISNPNDISTTSPLKTLTSSSRLLDDDGVNLKDSAVPRLYKCVLCIGAFLHCDQLNAHLTANHHYDLPYTCVFCPAMYSDKSSLVSHARKHLRKTTYNCVVCSDNFMRREDLKSHSLTHIGCSAHHGAFLITTGEKQFTCLLCPAKCVKSWSLRIHMRVHTGEKPNSSHYPARFARSDVLRSCIRKHTGDKPHNCLECPAKFAGLDVLRSDICKPTGEKSFSCSHCPAKFARSDALRLHIHTHTGEKSHDCWECPAKFARLGTLRSHMRTHTGEKPHSCSLCSAKFSASSTLLRHMRSHTGEKPFSCSLCPAKFVTSSQLKVHMRSHTGEKPYICSLCPAKFTISTGLKIHIRSHTGEKPYICSLCPAKFAISRSLKIHIRSHTGAYSKQPYGCS